MVDFGEKLKALRKAKGLSQQQLAERLSITKSMISAYETDMRLPSLDVIVKLSHVFGVTTDYLLGIDKHLSVNISTLTAKQKDIVIALIDELGQKK